MVLHCLRSPLASIALGALFLGCGGSDTGGGVIPGAGPGDAQTPPTGASAVDAWLGGGAYKAWHCEPTAHAARSPSPHGMNRICSNDALSTHASGTYPAGAAAVKEIYDGTGKNVVGFAVYRHLSAGTTGDTWYWYEKTASGVAADGAGSSGTPKDVCVGCHSAAGSDANHSGHDFVYTQVK